MRIVFMGTPEFAVPSFRRLLADGHQIVGVYTQPDKPKNRGMKLTPSPVKVAALEAGVPVYQPETLRDNDVQRRIRNLQAHTNRAENLRDNDVQQTLAALAPELIVVAAYGKILPREVLELPPYGCINVHASLLPKYRGAAPINWAIIDGEEETGVTIMHMAETLDTGDIISQVATPIDPDENVGTLTGRLAELGGALLGETVQAIANGTATRTPQDETKQTYAPMLSHPLSRLAFARSARELHNQIRGLSPRPGTFATVQGVTFKVYASALTGETTTQSPGTALGADRLGIRMACGDGQVLTLTEVQAPGKKRMKAADYLRGHPLFG